MSDDMAGLRASLEAVKADGGFEPPTERRVHVPPPPPLPPTERPANGHTTPPPPAIVGEDPAPPAAAATATKPRTSSTAARPRRQQQPEGGELPGTKRGNKRILQVSLPAPTRARLDHACKTPPRRSRGEVALEALRAHFPAMVAEHTQPPAPDPGDLFPAPAPRRRRLDLDDPRNVSFFFTDDETRAIVTAADQLGLTRSALLTTAIDRYVEN
jgi:hypothetical protein